VKFGSRMGFATRLRLRESEVPGTAAVRAAISLLLMLLALPASIATTCSMAAVVWRGQVGPAPACHSGQTVHFLQTLALLSEDF
jgi:hypothetical protein